MEGAAVLNTEEVETSKWNPLQCMICNEQYQEPCILDCYHSFCGACMLDKKDPSNNVSCPLCGSVTAIKEGSNLPSPDPLLKFLVESSAGDRVTCANCDQSSGQMYFCNTCTQPLCLACREETHRAKMFRRHDIVLHTKHTRDIQKECKIHGEPFILFSTEKKVMLCINCFRDMKIESRSHCVDLETAYKQGCQKLDDTMQSIRDLQSSVRDCILLLRALLEEIETNADKEKLDISEMYNTMQEKISQTKEALLKEIDRQYAEKEQLFKNQLVSLTTFLPTLHVHLVTCAAFSSSANKYEFLDFTYVLMKRLTALIHVQHPLHPSQTSDIITEYKAKFAQCLEPLLFPHRNGNGIAVPVSIASSVACTRYEPSPSIPSLSTSVVAGMSPGQVPQPQGSAPRNYRSKKFRLKLMETKGFFTDHCKEFDEAHRELMQKVEGLKQGVQELQRDITLRRSLTKDLALGELRTKIDATDSLLDTHLTNVENKQTGLQQHWEEALERIAGEQEVYQAQLQDVGRLKTEVAAVKTILQRLSSFVSSIANVTQRLAPKLNKATTVREQESQHAALLNTISTMQPDSQHRVDAIRTAQEERDIKSANRINPLDEELIKTKGLLRAPSARKDSSKRSSAEIKELLEMDEKDSPEKASSSNTVESSSSGQELPDDKENGNISKDAHVDKEKSDNSLTIVTIPTPNENCFYDDKGNGDKADTRSTDSGIGVDGENATNLACSSGTSIKINGNDVEVDETKENVRESADSVRVVNECAAVSPEQRKPKDVCDKVPKVVCAPDVTMQVSTKEEELSKLIVSSDLSEGSEVSADFNVDIVISECELDSSLDLSSSSLDDSIKEGHVKDIVTKVDERTKGALDGGTINGSKSQRSDKFLKINQEEKYTNGAVDLNGSSETSEVHIKSVVKVAASSSVTSPVEEKRQRHVVNGAEYDRVNQFIVVDTDTSDTSKHLTGSVNSESQQDIGAAADDEDVYIPKSLPELAQVFEPGELKQKKRRGKSEKEKIKES